MLVVLYQVYSTTKHYAYDYLKNAFKIIPTPCFYN